MSSRPLTVLALAMLGTFAGRVRAQAATEEQITVIRPADGVTATIVAPAGLDRRAPIDLILYALPNGNTTAETMGQRWTDGAHWRNDSILHTEMIGEMNAYLHAMLVGRPGYDDRRSVLGPPWAYMQWVRP